MIQSYKKNPALLEKYDAVIIGSGIGSMTAGAVLAKEGKKILILERHYTIGGFTHVFKRKNYEWDVGIHYIGEVQRPNSAIRKIFDYITESKLEWADMGEVYDRIIIGDEKFDFIKGVENFKSKMGAYFPKEKEAIDKYVDLVFGANKAMAKYYMDKALPTLVSKLTGGFFKKKYLEYADKTTYEVLKNLTLNEKLIKVLSGQYGDYGLSPKKSSFAMHASVVKHYFSGGSFPVGGSSEIAKTIDPVIEKAGGTMLVSAEVEEILIKNNRAYGVKMKDGKTFESDIIISGAGVFTTYEKLMPKVYFEKHKLANKLKQVKPSIAHGCLYIGLKGSPEELELPKTNLWIYPENGDHDTCVENYLKDNKAEFPVVYISFPSAKDPSWSSRYPGKSTIDIITLLPYEKFKKWENTRWMKRGDEYSTEKAKITDRLLEVLFKQFPHLRDKIDYHELSTPLTTKNFVNFKEGEIYGIEHTPGRYRLNFLRPKTDVKGLFLTGSDIVTAGIGAALFSGLITATFITGKNIMKKIYE